MDLTLPLPGSKPDYDPATDHLEYLKMLQRIGAHQAAKHLHVNHRLTLTL